jgi:tetratricopeptide (TPR) repeat protein
MNDPDRDANDVGLEPTIVPVRRPVVADPDFATADGRSGSQLPLLGAAVVLAVAGITAVFVYLPAWVEQSESRPVAAVIAVEPPAAEPALSAAEIAALRDQAESLLAELLEQRQELDTRSVASWGDTTWSSYETAARLGDDAFLAEDLVEAVNQYESALAIGSRLLDRSVNIMAEALIAGDAALVSGNAALAATQFALVLAVDPDNARAARGRKRAESLPDVLAAMRRGEELEQQGELEQAAQAFSEALAIDPDYAAAQAARASTNTRIAEARFDRLIGEGFAAVEAGRNDRAVEVFNQALALRPGSEAARDGLAAAQEGQLLDAIAMAEIRAQAFERRELWDQAIDRYREALASDSSLKFAIEGLARAQSRADLDDKLEALIASPRLLLTDDVLQEAGRLIEEAEMIDEPGPRLIAQTEQLARLIELASTPINITLISDNATEVTVYRVGELGVFTNKEIALKPGSYIAVGQRRGYRDVRESFAVLPGAANGPVTVVCVEAI